MKQIPEVNSFNEWDPLEEVIVGILDGGCEIPWELAIEAVTPEEHVTQARREAMHHGGQPIDPQELVAARSELEHFVHVLESEGVRVQRPDPVDHARAFCTPQWVSPGGNGQFNPRDLLLVIGNEIIESPMSWRSRYFEAHGYRRLLKRYFLRGAKWTAAPKPQLAPELFDANWRRGQTYVTTEWEPVFDAADVARCGRDLFVQRSHVTNLFGIQWLKRHLEPNFRVHTVEFVDDRAIHIDATFIPLCPGKILVNPDRPMKKTPEFLRQSGWEMLTPPRSTYSPSSPGYQYFRWLCLNVLMLDEHRVIVEKHEEPLIKALQEWGFSPIPVAFRHNYRFGGSFHCATVDIRRRGTLQCYF